MTPEHLLKKIQTARQPGGAFLLTPETLRSPGISILLEAHFNNKLSLLQSSEPELKNNKVYINTAIAEHEFYTLKNAVATLVFELDDKQLPQLTITLRSEKDPFSMGTAFPEIKNIFGASITYTNPACTLSSA
ncbi:MAG: hypothetical protein JNM68_15650, partial [Dinghuibacter sp.]|nr:hypothetical protein [Dinghuibacter sp.]